MMLNDEVVMRAARAFAERVRKGAGEDQRKQVTTAYRIAYGRVPGTDELYSALSFIDRQTKLLKSTAGDAFADFCHALLNSSEFIYVE
jgi:hypothetical protein